MTVVEVSEFGAVIEQHSVPLPVETVRQKHEAFGAFGHNNLAWSVKFGSCLHPIANTEINLSVVRC